MATTVEYGALLGEAVTPNRPLTVRDNRTPDVADRMANDGDPRADQKTTGDETLKRKASPEHRPQPDDSEPSKRPRHDSVQASDAPRSDHSQQRKPPSQPSAQDEKKRNKRLFGGLLSTLSQAPASNPAQKRRLEIERRQQDRLKRQREEDERTWRQRGEKRRVVKERDGILWEEEMMKNRHRRILGQARFLKTRARPTVYYLPAKRRAADDEMIEEQIRSTQRQIEREEDEFEEKKRAHQGRQTPQANQPRLSPEHEPGPPGDGQAAARKEADGPDAKAPEKDSKAPHGADSAERPQPNVNGAQGDHDESGDEVMDAEEDMVIY